MQRNKVFSIITIICFASIIFIPIGLVLMFYFTDWPKKRKIIIATSTTVLYLALAILLVNLKPADNTSGVSVPIEYDEGSTEFETNGKVKVDPDGDYEVVEGKGKNEIENPEDLKDKKIPSAIKKENKRKATRWLIPLLFFLTMLAIIIIQNIRRSKYPEGYVNPYVEVKKIKIPIEDESTFPTVHYLKINRNPDEKVFFATDTNEKDNEGDFVITNQRVVISNKRGIVTYKIRELTIASSISNTVMLLTAGNEKNYIFMPENQMKYALGMVRYAFKKYGN